MGGSWCWRPTICSGRQRLVRLLTVPIRLSVWVGLLVLWLTIGVVAQQATQDAVQQPPVTFRLEVNYVEVDAVVTDENGNFIDDLALSDFEVFEDEKVQEVSAFSLVNIPIERAERTLVSSELIEPDVSSNERPFDGRVFVLLLDDLQTTPLRTNYVKVAAKEFIERHLGANDLTAIFFASGRTDVSQGFTGNRRLLLEAVDKFAGQGARSSVMGRNDTYFRYLSQEDFHNTRVVDELDFERGTKARATLATLRELSDWLSGVRGRKKAVVFMSQGIDYDIYDVFNSPYASTIASELERTIGAAAQANVALYTLDPRGMTTIGSDQIESQLIQDDRFTGGGTGLRNDSLRYNLRLAQDNLQDLADGTGGMAFINSNDLSNAFTRIVEDNSSYYVLGYYPTNDRRDGRNRAIEVRVTRPGLVVRSRKGYQAPRGKAPRIELAEVEGASDALREVMTNPLPVSGLTLRVSAAPFLGERPKSSVAFVAEIGGQDLTFTEKNGHFEDTIELSLTILNEEGKVAGGESLSIPLELPPEAYEAVSNHGLKLISRFDLEPGRYQVRVAAIETGSSRSGSILYDLEVPDFSEGLIQMSGITMASIHASRTPTAKSDEQFQDVLPTQPTTLRDFELGDELFLFVEIYDNEVDREHTVDITTTITADDGRVVFNLNDVRSSGELEGKRGGYGHALQIPLQGVEPGLYILRTEARSRIDRNAVAMREVPFRLHPTP